MTTRRLARSLCSLACLLLATPALAGEGYPWIVVYSQKRCATVESVNPEFALERLLGAHGCVREDDIFEHEAILSVGCEESFGTGFVLARTEQHCQLALDALLEATASQAAE